MNAFQFISSIIHSLAWPVTILTLVILLQEPIRRSLRSLTKLRYKDLQLDFERGLGHLEEKANLITAALTTAQPTSEPTRRDSLQLVSEAQRLAEDLPEASVALGWSAVEDELMSVVMELGISPDYPPHNSWLKNAELLAEQNAIDAGTLDVLKGLRNLRNTAVHLYEELGGVTTDQARAFLAIAEGVIGRLRALRRR